VINLANTGDYIVVFALAAVAGIVGGLASELLLSRANGETGGFELPGKKDTFFDFGGFAPLFIGGVVGVAILIVFPPETTIVSNAADGSVSETHAYDVVRLVATSLVAGSAGGSVLSSLQARLTAAVSVAQVKLTADQGKNQLENLRDTVATEAEAQIKDVLAKVGVGGPAAAPQAQPRGDVLGAPMSTPQAGGPRPDTAAIAEEAISALREKVNRQVDQGQAAIDAAAGRRAG